MKQRVIQQPQENTTRITSHTTTTQSQQEKDNMSSSNEGGARPDAAMSNPSPITTTSAHDTSNRGGRGQGCGRGCGNSYRGRGGIRPRETQ